MSTIGYYICVPFAWVLRTFYELTGSYGWALVLFTIVVKLITLPFQMKSKKSMMRMNLFQPKIKEIQTKYANNPQKMNDEIQMLYAKEGVNPMSGCLWSFLPFPILIALYSIIRQPLSRFMMLSKDVVTEITTLATTLGYNAELVRKGYEEIGLAKFISDNFADFSGKFDGLLNVNYNFLGLDLTVMPGDVWKDFFTGGWPVIGVVLIPFISGALSFLQSKVSMSGNVAAEGNDAAARSNRMMMWMMPLMSLWIGFTLPAALGVYWIVNSLLYAIQEKVLTIGENLQIRRFDRFDDSTVNVAYNHMGGVIGVLVGLEVSEGLKDNATVKELGKDIGMQAAAMNPSFLDKSDVDEATLAKEKEVLLIQALEENKTAAKPKPEQIIHKMVDGRIGKYYEENCLLQQAFVKENKVSVENHIKAVAKELGGEIKLVKCVRFEKGEGIEKKVDDFAAEVASMAK